MERTDVLAALDRAIAAETKAREFYLKAAAATDEPSGQSMFREMADFEAHHREKLEARKQSLKDSGAYIEYRGRSFSKVPPAEAAGRPASGDHASALDALRLGIQAEERAEAEYRKLAAQVDDAAGQQMFERLAEEETLHRKVLDDQLYALTNRGVGLGGD